MSISRRMARFKKNGVDYVVPEKHLITLSHEEVQLVADGKHPTIKIADLMVSKADAERIFGKMTP